MKTSVLTSRKAKEHYEEIKQKHAEIITELNEHNLKVKEFRANEKIETDNKNAVEAENQKENQKNVQKQQELEIKRMALKSIN